GGEQQDGQELGPEQLPVIGVIGLVPLDVGGLGQHAADAASVGVGLAIRERGPPRPRHPTQSEGVVDPDGAEVGAVGAGGAEDVGFDGGGDQVALPFQDGRDDEAVGFEGAGWSEGQDRVALFDGQVQPPEEPVAGAGAAAQDDPAPPWAQDQEAAELPPARPLGAVLLAPAAGPGERSRTSSP